MVQHISLPVAMESPFVKREERLCPGAERKAPSSPRSPRLARSESTRLEEDARVEVAAQCRTKEVVIKCLEQLAASRGSLSRRNAQLLGATAKAMVTERRTFIRTLEALKVCASAAADSWKACADASLEASLSLSLAAARTAADLTVAGQSPSEAVSGVKSALPQGLPALRNLLPKWRVAQQARAREEAARVAAEKAVERARVLAQIAEASNAEEEGQDTNDASSLSTIPIPLPNSTQPQQASESGRISPHPESAAAVAAGAPLPKALVSLISGSEEWLRCNAYLQARLDILVNAVRAEVRDISLRVWQLTEPLLPNASRDTKVEYLQLRADLCRYSSQESPDEEKRDKFRAQALTCYEQALTLLRAKGAEAEASAAASREAESAPEDEEEEGELLSGRIGVLLNYAVLLHDDPLRVEEAILLLADEFKHAVKNVIHVTDAEESRRVVMAMGLLRDNVESWCREVGRSDAAALLGLDSLASPLPF